MRNSLLDLHNHLFAQMERLDDEEINDEELDKEIKRSKAMNSVASQIISNASLMLDAQKFQAELGYSEEGKKIPKLLTGE